MEYEHAIGFAAGIEDDCQGIPIKEANGRHGCFHETGDESEGEEEENHA